jgi:hypothetical protein
LQERRGGFAAHQDENAAAEVLAQQVSQDRLAAQRLDDHGAAAPGGHGA